MIRLENVFFSYGGNRRIIDDLSYTVEKGARVAIYGSNGAGKTTLANLMGGLLMPDSGRACVDGFCTAAGGALGEIRKKIYYIRNNPDNQIVAATVEEDIAFSLENRNLPQDYIKERLQWVSGLLGIEEIMKLPAYFLSPLDKLKVIVAGMAVMKPCYAILDCQELFRELWDLVGIEGVFGRLSEESEITVVYLTSRRECIPPGYRTAEMKGGKLKDL